MVHHKTKCKFLHDNPYIEITRSLHVLRSGINVLMQYALYNILCKTSGMEHSQFFLPSVN